MDLRDLAKPFPKEAIHWRAQSLTRDGKKAMALAYIDARDVMDRLDEVCGPENWQSSFTETARGRVLGSISIRVGDHWVTKGDGAGDTDVEGEKGGISDALKRAAVHWGVGRYLYRLSTPWVPCESYEKNGKFYWRKWTADPWADVRDQGYTPPPKPAPEPFDAGAEMQDLVRLVNGCKTQEQLAECWGQIAGRLKALKGHDEHAFNAVVGAKDAIKATAPSAQEAA